jgi:hypothetical protein
MLEARKDSPDFRLILVRIALEVDADRIVLKENLQNTGV